MTATATNNPTSTPNTSKTPAYDANGTFVWFELRTANSKQSLAFFTEVLGWKTKEMEMGEMKYTMLLAGEEPIGGISNIDAGPSSFSSYLHVEDVDAAAKRVTKAGGEVIGQPYDIPTVGRMVEVKDQDGATFFLYKGLNPATPSGRAPGNFHWNELWAKDEKRALSFLTSVVGYSVDAMPMPGMMYHVLNAKSGPAAGVMKSPVPNLAPHWLPYVHVENTDQTVARARAKGAQLEGEIADIPDVGRYAVLRAPDGARFAVIKPASRK